MNSHRDSRTFLSSSNIKAAICLLTFVMGLSLAPRLGAQAIVNLEGGGGGTQSIYILQGFPAIDNLCQFEVGGLPSFVNPHGVSYAGSDHAFVAHIGSYKIYYIKISTASLADTIDTTGKWSGSGTIAVNPTASHVLFSGDSTQAAEANKLWVMAAPFSASSPINSVTLPGKIPTYQTQAIDFDATGRAYVYSADGSFSNPAGFISILNPPYTSIAFSIPVPGNVGGALAVSPDGKTILTTLLANGPVMIFTAPFSAASVPKQLKIGSSTSPSIFRLDPIKISPDGTKALVAEADAPKLYAISAPFGLDSKVEQIPLPGGLIKGFEDIDISADGQNALLMGGSNTLYKEPIIAVRAPFTAAGATARTVDIGLPSQAGRGAGSGRFRKLLPNPALALFKCAPISVRAAQQMTYSLTVRNNAATAASSVVLRDNVPEGTTFVSASDGGTHSAGQVSWNLGTIAAGAQRTVTMVVSVGVSGGIIENKTYNVQAGAATAIPGPKTKTRVVALSVTKTAPASIVAGSNLTYTFNYSNNSTTATFTNVRIQETVPNNVTFVSATNGGTYFSFANSIRWELGTLAPGASGSVSATVKASTFLEPIVNTTYFISASELSPSEFGPIARTAMTPALTISKTGPSSFTPNGNMTYTITYSNASTTAFSNINIDDPIPTGTTFVSAANGGVLNGSTVRWTFANIPAGASNQTVSFTVKATATSGHIINTGYSIGGSSINPVYGNPVYSTRPIPQNAVDEETWMLYQ